MRSIYSLLTLTILTIGTLTAQDEVNKYGIYYTNSGSTYIAEPQDETNDDLNLITNDGNNISLDKFNIRAHIPADEVLIHRKGKYHRTKGFFINWTLGIGGGGDEDGNSSSSSNGLSAGYYLDKKFAVGVGAAIDAHTGELNGVLVDNSFIPITAFGRYYLTHKTNRIFAFGRAGYGLPFLDDAFISNTEGGFIGKVGIGIDFGSIKKSKFLLKAGYHFQSGGGVQTSIGPFGNEITTKYDIVYQRFMIGICVDFTSRKSGYK